MNKSVEDCLIVGVDFSPYDKDYMIVARRNGDKTYVINTLTDDEAVEIYNKLIGNVENCCKTCRHYKEAYSCYYCMHPNNFGYRVLPYTKCNDYERK